MDNTLLRQALDAAGEVIFMTDRNGVFTFVNRAFECLYGYSAHEVLGRCTPRILKGGATPEAFYTEWWTRLSRGESVRERFTNRSKDGTLVQVEVTANAVRGDLQEIVGFVAVQRDVTAQSAADAALKRSEARYRTLADTAADAIFIVDADNRFEYVNAAAARQLDAPVHSLIGRQLREIFAPEVGVTLDGQINLVRRRRVPLYEERQIPFPSGLRWAGASLQCLDTDEYASGSVMGIARDITKSREMADLLARQNLLLTSVINASPVGILLLSAETWVCDVANPAIHRLGATGLLPGVRLADGWPDAVATLVPVLTQALQTDVPALVEISLPGVSSESVSRRCTVMASRLQLPHRAPSVLMMLEDVSDRHHLQAQLLHAQKMEAIGRLAGGIAHDFNNLLTPILGYAELLTNTLAASDARRQDLDEISRAARSAGSLTRQLLTFSRKHVTEPTVLHLDHVLKDLDKILRRTLGEDLDLVQTHAADLGCIRGDRTQIEQVVMNLSVNARDAMPHGGALTITTENRTLRDTARGFHAPIPPGEYVVLSVADDGFGMAPEVVAHIFEPFYTTKEFGKGTGLGLSTVYGIVTESGGYMTVESAPDHGTTFTIFFPRVRAAVSVPSPSDDQSDALRGGDETVLVVEDNDALRQLTERVLAKAGYVTLTAANAQEALRLSREHRAAIDLLLTDVVMPGTDGVMLSQQLTAERPETHVLFMSGYSGRDLAERQSEPGPPSRRMLQKPFTPASLASAVREALDTRIAALPLSA